MKEGGRVVVVVVVVVVMVVVVVVVLSHHHVTWSNNCAHICARNCSATYNGTHKSWNPRPDSMIIKAATKLLLVLLLEWFEKKISTFTTI